MSLLRTEQMYLELCLMEFHLKDVPSTFTHWISLKYLHLFSNRKLNKIIKHSSRMSTARTCFIMNKFQDMSGEGGCTAMSNLNKFEHVWEARYRGWHPVQWDPSCETLNMPKGAGALHWGWHPVQGGPCMVKSNASWAMVTWDPLPVNRQTRLKILHSRNFIGGRNNCRLHTHGTVMIVTDVKMDF